MQTADRGSNRTMHRFRSWGSEGNVGGGGLGKESVPKLGVVGVTRSEGRKEP